MTNMKYMSPIKITIHLSNMNDIKEFNEICNHTNCDIDVSIGRYVVDGKSLLGMYSLDYSNDITIAVHSDDEDIIDPFLLRISKWTV